jgi:capsid protein
MANTFSRFFGKAYDAIMSKGRRRQVQLDTRTEDRLLFPIDRDQLTSNTRHMRRNAAIVAFAIRKHLDYVSTFTFQCRSGNPAVDRDIESLMNWYARPLNCDVSGRFSLQRIIRMLEASATVDGDAFIMKMTDGRIQLIEGDRVRTPTQFGEEWLQSPPDMDGYVHGVQITASGKPLNYAVCDRNPLGYGYQLANIVPAKYAYMHGYFDRYDQVRGISPLSSALNTFFDLYEATEYALAKMKLSQLFALKFQHAAAGDEVIGSDNEVKFDFGSGPQMMELEPDEDADFLESSTPSTEFQAFFNAGIQVGLKSLDIPFSFYDESHASFTGARLALLQYEQSCDHKRANLQTILNQLTVWRLSLAIADGDLVFPEVMTDADGNELPSPVKLIDDIDFEWIPTGLPWLDPLKEVTADTMAVQSGFKSRQMICKEAGTDFFRVADQIAQENEYLKSKGLNTAVSDLNMDIGEVVKAAITDAVTKDPDAEDEPTPAPTSKKSSKPVKQKAA